MNIGHDLSSSNTSTRHENPSHQSDAPLVLNPDVKVERSQSSKPASPWRCSISSRAPRRSSGSRTRHDTKTLNSQMDNDVHPIVLLLSAATSITTSILVGPSFFACQENRRTTWINILEPVTGSEFCSLLPRWAFKSESIPSPTIVLIIVQAYALSTVAFYRCRPQDQWKMTIMLLAALLGITLDPPRVWNATAILEHIATVTPRVISFGLLLSAFVHSRAHKQQRSRSCRHSDNSITETDFVLLDEVGMKPEKATSM